MASGGVFVPFFVAVNSGDGSIPTSVFALSVERAGDTATNGHIEINRNPRAFSKSLEPEADRSHGQERH